MVWIHVVTTVIQAETCLAWDGGWIASMISESFIRFAVPVFVMVTGLLLLNPLKDEDFLVFYKKRLLRLFVPFVFWIAFYMWFRYFLGSLQEVQPSFVQNPTIRHHVAIFMSGKIFYHLWYLFILPPLYLFTPFLRVFIKNAELKERLLFIALIFLFSFTDEGIITIFPNFTVGQGTFLPMFLPFLGYYLIGSELSRLEAAKTFKHSWMLVIFMIILLNIVIFAGFAILGESKESIIKLSLNVFVLPYSIAVYFFLSQLYTKGIFTDKKVRSVFKSLAKTSLGIYLIHPFYLELIKRTDFFKSFTGSEFIIFIPVATCLIFLICYLSILILSKIPLIKKIVV